MNFGELKPGDVLYLIDYNQFKKDLTYIKGLVQTVIVNEPPKENLNNVYQTLMQKTVNIEGMMCSHCKSVELPQYAH